MTKKQPTTETGNSVGKEEIIWEAVLTNDGWQLTSATRTNRSDGVVVRIAVGEAVPHAELQEIIRRTKLADPAPFLRLIVTTDGDEK